MPNGSPDGERYPHLLEKSLYPNGVGRGHLFLVAEAVQPFPQRSTSGIVFA